MSLLCDVDMPELNGYQVLQALRQDPDLEDISFIFLTALSSMDNLRKGMNLGADDYLTKPLQIDALLAAIATRLQKQDQHTHHQNKKLVPQRQISERQISERQNSERQISEKMRLTPRQHRVLQLVIQGKPIHELANNLAVSLDAAELLEDIATRLNRRLSLDAQLDIRADPQIDPLDLQQAQIPKDHAKHDQKLTPRQREILRLVANGMTTKEIAESLFISVKTVETHRGQLMERLNIHDLAGLIRYALRSGLIDLDD